MHRPLVQTRPYRWTLCSGLRWLHKCLRYRPDPNFAWKLTVASKCPRYRPDHLGGPCVALYNGSCWCEAGILRLVRCQLATVAPLCGWQHFDQEAAARGSAMGNGGVVDDGDGGGDGDEVTAWTMIANCRCPTLQTTLCRTEFLARATLVRPH